MAANTSRIKWIGILDNQGRSLYIKNTPKTEFTASNDLFGWTKAPEELDSTFSTKFAILHYVSKQPPKSILVPETNISVIIRCGGTHSGRFIGTQQDGVLGAVTPPNSYCVWTMQAYEDGYFTLLHPTKKILASTPAGIEFGATMDLDWSKLFRMNEISEDKTQIKTISNEDKTQIKTISNEDKTVSNEDKKQIKTVSFSADISPPKPQGTRESLSILSDSDEVLLKSPINYSQATLKPNSTLNHSPSTLQDQLDDFSMKMASSSLFPGSALKNTPDKEPEPIRKSFVVPGGPPLFQVSSLPGMPGQMLPTPTNKMPGPPPMMSAGLGPLVQIDGSPLPVTLQDVKGRYIVRKREHVFEFGRFRLREDAARAAYFDLLRVADDTGKMPSLMPVDLSRAQGEKVVLRSSESGEYLGIKGANVLFEYAPTQFSSSCVWELRRLPHSPYGAAFIHRDSGKVLASNSRSGELALESGTPKLSSAFVIVPSLSAPAALGMIHADTPRWIEKSSPYFGALGAISGMFTGSALVANIIKQSYDAQPKQTPLKIVDNMENYLHSINELDASPEISNDYDFNVSYDDLDDFNVHHDDFNHDFNDFHDFVDEF